MNINSVKSNKSLILFTIIFAGEAVFFLPFVMARIFRPTLLEVFQISNVELGTYFSVYGFVAMVSYFFGGILADKFTARYLMSVALWLTALGGIVMSFIPSGIIMMLIYAFWALTSIFLFWAAMIRATRELGGVAEQGRTFGWLEGGRGATAALMGTIAFLVFAGTTPTAQSVTVQEGGLHPFQIVILVVSGLTFLAGILIWFIVPNKSIIEEHVPVNETITRIRQLLRMPSIWMLSIIIVCAYVGYKITDDFSLYAREVLGFSEVNAASVGTAALWLRAFVAISVGYLGDRFNSVNIIIYSFVLSILGGVLFFTGLFNKYILLALLNLIITAAGIYGIRALYFAVLKQAKIPLLLTGTAVGIVSVIGFTPDVFMSPWMGYLLDSNPGVVGHQNVFLVLASFSVVGLIVSLFFKIQENR